MGLEGGEWVQIIDNITQFLGDDIQKSLRKGDKLKIAAATFSIYAYEALKNELQKIDSLEFIFTAPTFTPNEATDKFKKESREFYIPKNSREKSFYGTEFEIELKNKLTQRAVAKECAKWIRQKATFKSNKTSAPMQQFACIEKENSNNVYMPLGGFNTWCTYLFDKKY